MKWLLRFTIDHLGPICWFSALTAFTVSAVRGLIIRDEVYSALIGMLALLGFCIIFASTMATVGYIQALIEIKRFYRNLDYTQYKELPLFQNMPRPPAWNEGLSFVHTFVLAPAVALFFAGWLAGKSETWDYYFEIMSSSLPICFFLFIWSVAALIGISNDENEKKRLNQYLKMRSIHPNPAQP